MFTKRKKVIEEKIDLYQVSSTKIDGKVFINISYLSEDKSVIRVLQLTDEKALTLGKTLIDACSRWN